MRWRGLVYRAHNPKWHFAPESGEGAALTGGRFNPRGQKTLYTSLRFETAWLEAQQGFPFKAQPLTLCAYDVDCDEMRDLTDPATLTAHGINPDDLACAWKDHDSRGLTPPSWIIARDLSQTGVAGILAPSYARGATGADRNAVFWHWGPQPPHQVKVIDDEHRLRPA